MSIDPESIKAGKCYLTHTGVVRRFITIHDGRVLYETRMNKSALGSGWIPGIVDPRASDWKSDSLFGG